jgi:hypothetical protein
MAGIFDLARRVARALHPFVLVTTRKGSCPLDTDKASELADRLWNMDGGRELATRIHHALAIRGYVNPGDSERLLLEAVSEWIAETGEHAAGKQLLDLQAELRSDLAPRV